MQKFEFLRQPLLTELAMSWREEERREKNAIYSGHLGLCQQPRAATHSARTNIKCSMVLGPLEQKRSWVSTWAIY